MAYRGFILQATYSLEGGRPVVHLFGRLESGDPFLLRDDRQQPGFFLRRVDEPQAKTLGVARADPSTYHAFRTGQPLLWVPLTSPAEAPPLRDLLHRQGIYTYQADLRFARRFLLERGIRSSLMIDGEPTKRRDGTRVFHNSGVAPCRWALQPRVLSLDIETDARGRRLLSVALAGCGAREVLLLTPKGMECPPPAQAFPTEAALLEALSQRIQQLDPDVLTGWNLVDFDLRVLDALARQHRVDLAFGRSGANLRLRPRRSGRNALEATVPGRVVLDGLELLRTSFVTFEEYSLDAVARKVLGSGKTDLGEKAQAGDKAAAILHLFRHDRPRFVEYNLRDADLVLEILDKLGLIELTVERSLLTGLPPDRVSGSVAAFEFLYLSELTARQIAAPSLASPEVPKAAAAGGGHVLEPKPGLYRQVAVFDFQSLYPSLIRTFQIDPLGRLEPAEPDQDSIRAPNGARFRRQQGILPALLDELFPRRAEAKERGDKVASQAIKILMNSFYGVLGTPGCRFHHNELANAITSFGREMLLWTKARIEEAGFSVLYGDTDSLFVATGEDDPERAQQVATDLALDLNKDLTRWIEATWQVPSKMTLELERVYLRLFLPPMRHSAAGARKRYVGLVEEEGRRRVVFTGMEAVRRDWTDLARRVQREIYRRLFQDQPVADFLRNVVEEVRAGKWDEELVYRKVLRKKLEAYTATSPPHVVAARKMKSKPRRLIRYVITRGGPEPATENQHPLDYEHYIAKQIRPVAEPVLQLQGLYFEKVIGDDRQMELF